MAGLGLWFVCLAAVQLCKADEKRILLHSDDDVLQELFALRAEFQQFKSNSSHQIAMMENQMKDLQRTSAQAVRTSYVRWGRNVCPAGAELVYKGYIGGKKFDATGSGSDSVCLPADPTWQKYKDGVDTHHAFIYGTELDVWDSNHFFDYSVFNQDMPCAVCSVQKSTSMMIPARKNCYSDWTMEYNGYLVSAIDYHPASYDHICMDLHPEFLPHGANDDNDHVLYLVEGRCGSLPCPPYVEGRELACVVCSK